MSVPRLAIVGCGSITRDLHLPALRRSADVRLVGLVDPRIDAARTLAGEYGVAWTAADHHDAIGRADAVLLAVPNHLHAQMAIEFLQARVHVLVEKPMAPTVAECDRMIEVAEKSGCVLAVGLVRRFYDSTALVASLVRDRPLGAPKRFRLVEGERYRQRVQSAFRFDRDQSGGGVLADRGIHALDLLCHWFGEPEWLEYADDAEGGVEAEACFSLRFAGAVSGDVLVTRLRNVPNSLRLELEHGVLELERPGWPHARAVLAAGGVEWRPREAEPADPWLDVVRRQLADFAAAIQDGREPVASAREGRRSVELLERCYAARRPLEHSWDARATAAVP